MQSKMTDYRWNELNTSGHIIGEKYAIWYRKGYAEK